jgi:hypothetical protein
VSYRDHLYPNALDWQAVSDLIRNPDLPVKVKAGLHVIEFVASNWPGEPGAIAPIGALPFSETAIETAAPFELEEAQTFEEESIDAKQGFGEIVLILRLLATIRKYAPELLEFAKKLVGL